MKTAISKYIFHRPCILHICVPLYELNFLVKISVGIMKKYNIAFAAVAFMNKSYHISLIRTSPPPSNITPERVHSKTNITYVLAVLKFKPQSC